MAKVKYKDMELEEVTEPQIFDPPIKMVVWNNKNPQERMVLEVLHNGVAVTEDHIWYNHCALLPEKPSSRRATNRELAKWLAQGNGEEQVEGDTIYTAHYYNTGDDDAENEDVWLTIKVRKWDDTEWHSPTIDYMGIEE